MSAPTRRRGRSRFTVDIWPGFVDALGTLLLVVMFLLTFFALAQFFLNQALTGRDEALGRLRAEITELADLLALERDANLELRQSIAQLSASLQSAQMTRDDLGKRVRELEDQLAAAGAGDEAAERETALRERYAESQEALAVEREKALAAQAEVELLNQQLLAVRQQLASLQKALEASEAKDKEQQAQIVNLSKRLNAALASKVEELARYRSEFFGRLRDLLGERKDVRIVGDRFVFQSEVLFASGSESIGSDGRAQLAELARALKEVAAKIPEDIHWVLQVEGHTDVVPIRSDRFPSNWELSQARALSVVYFLQSQGIPPERLAAVGYGPYQPIDPARTDEAFQRNRRIELRLTQR